MTDEQAAQAVANCHEAFTNWKLKSPEARGEVLKKVGENLKEHKQEFVDLMIEEMGKLRPQGKKK